MNSLEISLEIIKNAEIKGNTQEDEINRSLKELVKIKTNDFINEDNISSEKIDMTSTIQSAGYDTDKYRQKFGSTIRSEQDVVNDLAKRLSSKDAGKDKKLKLIRIHSNARSRALDLD